MKMGVRPVFFWLIIISTVVLVVVLWKPLTPPVTAEIGFTEDGTPINRISEIVPQGNTFVVVILWAADCRHCKAFMQEAQVYWETMQGVDGAVFGHVLALNIADDPERTFETAGEWGVTYPVLTGAKPLPRTRGTPYILVLIRTATGYATPNDYSLEWQGYPEGGAGTVFVKTMEVLEQYEQTP